MGDSLFRGCFETRMKGSPIFPKDDNGYLNDFGYDPQKDFKEFLEEARKHEREEKTKSSLTPSNGFGNTVPAKDKKSNMPWKQCLFFWKKKRLFPTGNSRARNRHRGPVSVSISGDGGKINRGPVSGPLSGAGAIVRSLRRTASGPLVAKWFTPTMAEESEVPYMSLEKQNQNQGSRPFGPIYLVT